MKKISAAELKKAILAVETERLKHPATFRPDRVQRAALQKSRQASDKMVSGLLKKTGLDLKQFQALHEKRSTELNRMVAQQKTRPSSSGRSRSRASPILPPCPSGAGRNSDS
jgi:hypothetical protein